jgi:succinate dehydrogenase / fumarate reductase membrane anchor subunit
LNLVTPLNRVLGLGSAKGGAEHWWMQRLTAVALLFLGSWFCAGLLLLDDFAYPTVVAWIERPVTSILLILFVVAAGYHSYLGVQVVIEDYVHAKPLKVTALMLSAFGHFALSIAALFAILKIALTSAP